MMNALKKMYKGTKHAVIHQGPSALGEAAVYGGASYIFGQIHGRYREKAAVKIAGYEVPVSILAGVACKAASMAVPANAKLAGVHIGAQLNNVGNAGVGAFFHGMGVGHGMKASGRKLYILESGKAAPAALGDLKQTDVVGSLPPAPKGAYLSTEDLRGLARNG